MKSFSIYIFDKRYSAPTLLIATTVDQNWAREIALERLAESEHHVKAEVWEGDRMVFAMIVDPAAPYAGLAPGPLPRAANDRAM